MLYKCILCLYIMSYIHYILCYTGIAVDDATDAAKNAAAMILTTPGIYARYIHIVGMYTYSYTYMNT